YRIVALLERYYPEIGEGVGDQESISDLPADCQSLCIEVTRCIILTLEPQHATQEVEGHFTEFAQPPLGCQSGLEERPRLSQVPLLQGKLPEIRQRIRDLILSSGLPLDREAFLGERPRALEVALVRSHPAKQAEPQC